VSVGITEDQLEKLCLDWFKSIGYDYVCGYDIAPDGDSLPGHGTPERTDYCQIVLFDRLLTQLQKINPHTPVSVLETVSQQIAKPEPPILIKSNKTRLLAVKVIVAQMSLYLLMVYHSSSSS